MTHHDVQRNVSLYTRFVLFSEPLFWGPILIIATQKLAHMSLSDIYFMESIVVVLCVLLDIPSGALADIIGKRRLLIIGRVILCTSYCIFACMTSSVGAWVANIFWAIGISFQSGADVSLLYGSLKHSDVCTSFKKIEGRAVGMRYILMACAALSVSWIATIDLRLPLLISLPFLIIPILSAYQFVEPTCTTHYTIRTQYETLRSGVLFALRNPYIRWIILFCALIAGISKVWFFTYNPYFEFVHIPISQYGFIFFLLNIVAWVSSYQAHRISHILKEQLCVIGMVACIALPILLMGCIAWWPCAYLVLIQNIVRGFMQPFLGDFINRHIITEHIRTTVLSVKSSITNIVSIGALAGFGILTNQFTLTQALCILGGFCCILGSISIQRYRILFVKNKVPHT